MSNVRITIQGRRYTVRSDDGDVDIQAVAEYVDAKINRLSRRIRSVDDYTVVVLAALNIAEDYARFRKQMDRDLEDLDKDLASTSVMLESLLPPASP